MFIIIVIDMTDTDTKAFRDRQWFAFFSHSGAEIVNLSKALRVKPTKIITNRPPGHPSIDKRLSNMNVEIVYVSDRPSVEDYERILNRCNDCVCTLHGWMRIIPEEICDVYDMYNLHPGLICEYPELRGADPQWRVDSDKHDWIGLVIHRVSPGVDEGQIMITSKTENIHTCGDQIADTLHDMALDAWIDFLENL